MFLHFRGGLIEYGLHLTSVLPAKFVELLCSAARDLFYRLPLLSREIEFASKAVQEHVSDYGTLSGKDSRYPVAHIHSGSNATDQDAGDEKNQEPNPYFPFGHDDHLVSLQSECLC